MELKHLFSPGSLGCLSVLWLILTPPFRESLGSVLALSLKQKSHWVIDLIREKWGKVCMDLRKHHCLALLRMVITEKEMRAFQIEQSCVSSSSWMLFRAIWLLVEVFLFVFFCLAQQWANSLCSIIHLTLNIDIHRHSV